MAAVNMNMFEAKIVTDNPSASRPSLMVLPLNLIAGIVSHVDKASDLSSLCQTCRVLNYMALPQLYKSLTLTSYDKIRYRGDEPEGWGSASPFSMGLNALITRPYASLVRSLTLRGEWREHEIEEHGRVGRVPDSSMMLNIAVRAAIDRMPALESFSWELNTKMLETVYIGLAQRPKLTSLTIRFPSNRHPRPTTVIPAMPHLRCLKVTDIDPLCYPDDISTLLLDSRKLRELKMHWSPRMRNAQEPSVVLHDYFRKCIAAKQPLKITRLAFQNLYARHVADAHFAFDQAVLQEVTMLNDAGGTEFSFIDNSWPAVPPPPNACLKTVRSDVLSKRHCDFLSLYPGLENLYCVSSDRDPAEQINNPRRPTATSSAILTPPINESILPITNLTTTTNGSSTPTTTTEGKSPTPSPATTSPQFSLTLRDSYLNTIFTHHGPRLRRLLLPSRWPLPATSIARLAHTCPHLEQLALAADVTGVDQLAVLLPFFRNLVALRLLIPTGPSGVSSGQLSTGAPPLRQLCGSIRTLAELVEQDDEFLTEKLSLAFADRNIYRTLRIVGMGSKAWELQEFYQVPAPSQASDRELQSESQSESQIESPEKPPPNQRPRGSPPSVLGKRARDRESEPPRGSRGDEKNCLPALSVLADASWRRRLRRVGWEVLKNWEVWALDTQEI
ncbi:hypothetical protein ASPZODRAFT_127067 [Penicilliopsis zonata CBS 506.65]|uniref:F-box domain-containing protein n=1 Tax=Penicilliopsis zonata CBS 506.65 TaxID=1073090 RepID=A0A1L9SVC0_9EURO|nr:hypothetical protein ASPZODRAFT_127067 [Penicilliopsis zonata CBS 506.65]OJJ51061.1 hypothetical protein ASPZODRAFT_127067 [Penicilliopsis zonata CBS 506.65]